jgi:RNA 2',3'-cyclic 3'-phosphodiesterase
VTVRLFTALWPAPEAVAALAADTMPAGAPPGWRVPAPASWHVTLAFHGDADPGVLARRLERTARAAMAPRLRIAGAGAFEGVRWAGVEVADADAERLARLVMLAGGDPSAFVPHVSVLRLRSRPGPGAEPDPQATWGAHRGPWWRPQEVLLVVSEPARGGSRYRPVHRVRLASE